MQDKKQWLIGIFLGASLLFQWALGFLWAPVDQHQGEVYRIIFLHVPSAFTAFASSLLLALVSIWTLRKKSVASLHWGRAAAEVGLLFTILTLATGSIWGRPTWGTWWTWDARLTTTFLLALLYAGYLILYASLEHGTQRMKACAVLGILIFADVPVIYKSVTWWRTLHQPPSMMREGGSTMEPEILKTLLLGIAIMTLLAIWLISQRAKNLAFREELESSSLSILTKPRS